MALSNRVHDLGFPFRNIKTSKYIKSMRKLYKEDLNKCLVNAAMEAHIEPHAQVCGAMMVPINEINPINKKPADSSIKDKRIRSKKSLMELELWYESYVNEHHNKEQSSPDNDLL